MTPHYDIFETRGQRDGRRASELLTTVALKNDAAAAAHVKPHGWTYRRLTGYAARVHAENKAAWARICERGYGTYSPKPR